MANRSLPSSRPQELQDGVKPSVRSGCAPHDQIQQIVIRKSEQFLESRQLFGIQAVEVPAVELLQNKVQLQQPPPAMPFDLAQFTGGGSGRHVR